MRFKVLLPVLQVQYWLIMTLIVNEIHQFVKSLSSSLSFASSRVFLCWSMFQRTSMFVIMATTPSLFCSCFADLTFHCPFLCISIGERRAVADIMTLQAAVKDVLWHHVLPDATVASSQWRRWEEGWFLHDKENWSARNLREEKTKGVIAGFFSCTVEEIRA